MCSFFGANNITLQLVAESRHLLGKKLEFYSGILSVFMFLDEPNMVYVSKFRREKDSFLREVGRERERELKRCNQRILDREDFGDQFLGRPSVNNLNTAILRSSCCLWGSLLLNGPYQEKAYSSRSREGTFPQKGLKTALFLSALLTSRSGSCYLVA